MPNALPLESRGCLPHRITPPLPYVCSCSYSTWHVRARCPAVSCNVQVGLLQTSVGGSPIECAQEGLQNIDLTSGACSCFSSASPTRTPRPVRALGTCGEPKKIDLTAAHPTSNGPCCTCKVLDPAALCAIVPADAAQRSVSATCYVPRVSHVSATCQPRKGSLVPDGT